VAGGVIHGGTVVATNGNSLTASGGALDGVTVIGTLDVGNSVNAAGLAVTNGLTIVGTALLGNPTNNWYGQITFGGNQTLGGAGTVVFGNGNPSYNALRVANDGGTLQIGSGITIRGQNGTVGYSPAYGGPQDVTVFNRGIISADVGGGTIFVAGQPLNNQGQLQSPFGTLNLAGTIASGGLGGAQSGGGQLELSGFLTNDSQTVFLDGANDVLTLLAGGTIHGGLVVTTNGSSLVVSGGTLDSVTVNGTLDVGNSVNGAALVVTNFLVLNGTALVGNPTNNWYGSITFAGTQLLSGQGAFVFGNGNASYNSLRLANDAATLVIGSGITIRGQNGSVGYASGYGGPRDITVVNEGAIVADANGGTIYVAAQPLSNLGQLASPAGTLNIASDISTGGLGNIQGGNGLLGFSGYLTNDSASLVLAGTNTAFTILSGGEIHGGTVVATNGNSLVISSGILDGVTVVGTLDVGNTVDGATVTVTNGLTLNGTALVGNPTNSWYGSIGFAGSQTLVGPGVVAFGNSNPWGNGSANALYPVNGATTLTIGAGVLVRGQNGTVGSAGYPWSGPTNIIVANQGEISADVAGGTIYLVGQPVINQGQLQSPAGTLDLAGTVPSSALGNAQSLGGVLGVSGYLENAGETLVLAGTSNNLTLLSGGEIHGGAVVATNGNALVISSGTLDGVTIVGTLDVGNTFNSATLAVTNNLILNGTALVGNPTNTFDGEIAFWGGQTLGGNGTVVFGNNGNYSYNALRELVAGATLTIGPGITVSGQNGAIGYASAWNGPANVVVVNDGTISASVAGGGITLYGDPVINQGRLQAPSGNLNLAGTVQFGAGGSLQGGNGSLEMSGYMTNDNQTVILSGTNTMFALVSGGEIHGGSVVATNGNSLVISSGVLDGVTVTGTLDVGNTYNGASLAVTNNLVLNGTAWVGNPTNSLYGSINFLGSQSLGGAGMVVFGDYNGWNSGSANALFLGYSGTTLTIGPGITVRGQSGMIGEANYPWNSPANVAVVNQGIISADGSGEPVTVNAQPLVNQGRLQSTAGTLNLAGTVASLGATGLASGIGVVELSGYLTNDSQVVMLAGVGNALTLVSGGEIHGGAVVATNGASLVVSSGTVDGVTVDGTLDVGNTVNGANLSVTNNLVLNGAALVGNPTNSSYGEIGFWGSQTLGGHGTVAFGANSSYSYNSLREVVAGATLTIGAGITVQGQNGTLGYASAWNGPANVAVVNQGTISANVSGGTIYVAAQPFSNQGVVETPGGSLNTGYLDNTGQTIVADAATGSLELGGGWIHGGTLRLTNSARLVVGSQNLVLDGVTVNGNLDVGSAVNGVMLTVTNGLTLNGIAYVGSPGNGNYGSIAFLGSQTLGGNGEIALGNSSYNALWLTLAGTTLTNGPGVTARGESGWIGAAPNWPWYGPGDASLVNLGAITVDQAGGGFNIAGASFENDGLVGVADGAGLQVSAATVVNTGTIQIDRSAVAFSGQFFQTNGTLDFGLVGPDSGGQVVLNGPANVGGTLAAHLEDGYSPSPGDVFSIVSAGTNFVVFTNFNLPGPELWATNSSNGMVSLAVIAGFELEVSVAPTNEIVAAGSSFALVATVNQPGEFGFQWQYNGVGLPGATNASLVLDSVTKAASGDYTVVVTSSIGAVTSAPAAITVLAPAVIVAPPAPAAVHVGGDVVFNVAAAGDPPLSYEWFFNGEPLAWATGPSLALSGVGRPQAGAYSVAVGNLAGSSTSAPVALAILAGPDCPGAPGGMLAWWRGEGNSFDYAGTNDLAFIEAAYAPGEVGQAFALNGFNSYLAGPAQGLAPSGTNDFSIEFWANFAAVAPSTMAGDGSIVFLARDEGLGEHNKWLFGLGGGFLYLYLNGPAAGPQFLAQALFAPATNQWYHLALTRGGAVFRVYVDGFQVSAETNNVSIPVADAPLTIGQAQGLFMPGLLDEISIYNRALAPGEIEGIFAAGSFGKCGVSAPLAIGTAGFNATGHFQVQILGGQAGASVHVQSSSNLRTWADAGTVVLTGSPVIFTDPAAKAKQPTFYRAVINP
jgi:hypothetical protein